MPGARWDGETLTVSQSWINTFRKCPEQARRSLTGELKDFPGPAALVGIFAHAGIASIAETPVKEIDALELISVIDQAAQVEADDGNPNITNDIIHDSIYVLQCWMESGGLRYLETLKDVRAEPSFLVPFGDGVMVMGSSDIVHSKGCTDWKFPASMQRWKKEWEFKRYAVQPTVYMSAFDRLGDDFQWDFYVVAWADKPTTQVDQHVSRSWDQRTVTMRRYESDVVALKAELQAIRNLVMSVGLEQTWPMMPTDWHCSPPWCEAYASCQGLTGWVQDQADQNNKSADGRFSYREWVTINFKENN